MTAIDLGLGVLDHQLLDSEERRCGKVDDLELEGAEVVAILTGAPAWRGRGLLGRLLARLARQDRTVRVPWSEVEGVDSGVRLARTARELRLGRGDDRLRPLIEKLPGGNL